jgi:hypothetical protein
VSIFAPYLGKRFILNWPLTAKKQHVYDQRSSAMQLSFCVNIRPVGISVFTCFECSYIDK